MSARIDIPWLDEWPTCYYSPEHRCGDRMVENKPDAFGEWEPKNPSWHIAGFCECPSCPVRCSVRDALARWNRDEELAGSLLAETSPATTNETEQEQVGDDQRSPSSTDASLRGALDGLGVQLFTVPAPTGEALHRLEGWRAGIEERGQELWRIYHWLVDLRGTTAGVYRLRDWLEELNVPDNTNGEHWAPVGENDGTPERSARLQESAVPASSAVPERARTIVPPPVTLEQLAALERTKAAGPVLEPPDAAVFEPFVKPFGFYVGDTDNEYRATVVVRGSQLRAARAVLSRLTGSEQIQEQSQEETAARPSGGTEQAS